MSDLMLYGVLEMPFPMAMSGEIAQYQFWSRAQEAAKRLKAAEARLAELDRAPVSTPQQSAQRASVDTPEFRNLLWACQVLRDGQFCDRNNAEIGLIAHINAWGSAGSGATSEAVSVMLWLYRRLPRTYGRPPHVEQPIIALAKAAGIDMKDVTESFAERGAAPSPAPQGEQA